MQAVREQVAGLVASLRGVFRATRESYAAGSRFAKMRVWIIAILALDAILTVTYVIQSGAKPLDVVVWFEPGFPANMLVLRNEGGEPLEDVTLILDRKYELEVERIEEGLNGYEVNRAFRDREDLGPPESYAPKELEIRIEGRSVRIPVGASHARGAR